MVSNRIYEVRKFALRLTCCCLSFGLLTLLAGCGQKDLHSAEHTEVSGKVLYQGRPLPGGQVTFVTVEGGFAASAPIDENGNYQIKAPVGDVEIGVDNHMLQPRRGASPAQMHHPKQPGAEANKKTAGRWVNIPSSYADPTKSGLKYTVTAGSQTHDIELSVNHGSASRTHGS